MHQTERGNFPRLNFSECVMENRLKKCGRELKHKRENYSIANWLENCTIINALDLDFPARDQFNEIKKRLINYVTKLRNLLRTESIKNMKNQSLMRSIEKFENRRWMKKSGLLLIWKLSSEVWINK